MKANELMIGDWVYRPTHTQKIRVKNILEVGGYFQQEICGSQGDMYIEMVNIEPIPLTEEILKANGFKLDSDGYNWYHPTYSPEQVYVHVALRKNGNVRRVEVKKQRAHFYRDTLPYAFPVHELQHALRLCGLDELADNFKVE